MGFMDGGGLKRTIDGGYNWTQIPGEGLFSDMYFVDSLTGWKANQLMKMTTDGGLTWQNQTLPSGGNIVFNYLTKFSNVNRDTIWGVGGVVISSGSGRGMLFRTVNHGQNWLFQIADTSVHIFQYFHNQFVNRLNGWAYAVTNGVHTVTGGDTVFYTGIKQIRNNFPDHYKLFQNYPNPFNNSSKFKVQISKSANIEIKVYDVTGKLMITILNRKLNIGTYEINFDGSNYSSGVYFYSLIVDGNLIDTKKMILLK
jgi:hypothetical protein